MFYFKFSKGFWSKISMTKIAKDLDHKLALSAHSFSMENAFAKKKWRFQTVKMLLFCKNLVHLSFLNATNFGR